MASKVTKTATPKGKRPAQGAAMTGTNTTVSVQTNQTPASSPDATFVPVNAVADLAPLPVGYRRKLLEVEPSTLLTLFREMAPTKPGRMICASLPDDLRVVSFNIDYPRGLITILVESQTFELVLEGQVYPSMNVVLTREL